MNAAVPWLANLCRRFAGKILAVILAGEPTALSEEDVDALAAATKKCAPRPSPSPPCAAARRRGGVPPIAPC